MPVLLYGHMMYFCVTITPKYMSLHPLSPPILPLFLPPFSPPLSHLRGHDRPGARGTRRGMARRAAAPAVSLSLPLSLALTTPQHLLFSTSTFFLSLSHACMRVRARAHTQIPPLEARLARHRCATRSLALPLYISLYISLSPPPTHRNTPPARGAGVLDVLLVGVVAGGSRSSGKGSARKRTSTSAKTTEMPGAPRVMLRFLLLCNVHPTITCWYNQNRSKAYL